MLGAGAGLAELPQAAAGPGDHHQVCRASLPYCDNATILSEFLYKVFVLVLIFVVLFKIFVLVSIHNLSLNLIDA